MEVYTEHNEVNLQERCMKEFLLANHPFQTVQYVLYQGGECDLQKIYLLLWFRIIEEDIQKKKVAVSNKELGHIYRTSMTRCIHCTDVQIFKQNCCV